MKTLILLLLLVQRWMVEAKKAEPADDEVFKHSHKKRSEPEEEEDEMTKANIWRQQSEMPDCIKYCRDRQGDGKCDRVCNLAKCQYDLNDCLNDEMSTPSKSSCNDDGKCDARCEIAGLQSGTCRLEDGAFKEHAVVTVPVHPFEFFGKFERVENLMSKKSGINIFVQARPDGPMIYGWPKGSTKSELMFMDRKTKAPSMELDYDGYQNKTAVVLLLDSDHVVSYDDEHVMKVLHSLGTKSTKAIDVGLYPFWRNDLVYYNPGFINAPRLRQRAERTEGGGRGKHHLKSADTAHDD